MLIGCGGRTTSNLAEGGEPQHSTLMVKSLLRMCLKVDFKGLSNDYT